jgi:outer membrane protein OmpA-like peptidoglycan-associated protein
VSIQFSRSILLSSTALAGALTACVATQAQAQSYSTAPGFYLSLEGRYTWSSGSKVPNYAYAASGGGLGHYARYGTSQSAGDPGPAGKLMVGYRFGNNWDLALGVAGGRLKGKDSAHSYSYTDHSQIVSDNLKTTLTYTNIDFEAGYTMPVGNAASLRFFGGLRFAYYKQNAKGNVGNLPFASSYHDYNGERKTTYFGVGPRIGANGSVALGEGGFNLFGGVSFALLVGRLKDRHSFSYDSTGKFYPGGSFSYTDRRQTRIVPNAEGELGIGYNFNAGGTTLGLQLGYRAEAVSGAATTGFVNGWYAAFNKPKPVGDYLLHGPFLRLVASFGAAAPAAAASAPPPPAPMAKSVMASAAFDRSTGSYPVTDAGAAPPGGAQTGQTLLASASPTATAAMPPAPTGPALMPGFFGALSGWYNLDAGTDRTVARTIFGFDRRQGATHPDGGPGAKLYLGYRFAQMSDVALGLQGSRLNKNKRSLPAADASTEAWYGAVDAELGHSIVIDRAAIRLFGGLRYARFNHRNEAFDGFDVKTFTNNYWGVGPRVGADFNLRLGNSAFSLFGDVAGSALFGKLSGKHQFEDCANSSDCSYRNVETRTVWNAEGQIGVAYEVAPGVNLGVGYRAEYWSGVADASYYLLDDVIRSGRVDRVMHGPFARVSYNFGPPVTVMPAAVSPPPMINHVAKSFIVFFDFDRSNITAQAQKTINDAVAAAKAGNSTRITLTGHTDRSGSEQYNQALSVRRGEAVKAAMIRGGIPANAIVVIGRGESQPLVPTADGVREPQNRRVEIVI